jgi:hypothetical protein
VDGTVQGGRANALFDHGAVDGPAVVFATRLRETAFRRVARSIVAAQRALLNAAGIDEDLRMEDPAGYWRNRIRFPLRCLAVPRTRRRASASVAVTLYLAWELT